MLVVRIGPWRLWGRPDAERWRGVNAATAAGRLRGCRTAPGRSHFSLEVECVAVMIHLMRGAGEHRDAHSSSSHARVAGKPCGPLWRRPHTAASARLKSWAEAQPAEIRASVLSEITIRPCLAAIAARHGIALRSYRNEPSHRRQASPFFLGCGSGGELRAPGQFACLSGRRRKTDTAVSDRIF